MTGQGLAQAAVDGVLSNRIHPKTGEPIVPLGFRRDNSPIWPIMGASPDDDSNDDGTGDDDGNDDGDDGGNDDGSGDDDDAADEKAKKDGQLAKENARRRTENKQLQKQLADVSAKLKEFEDANKDDLTKTSEKVTELSTENEKLTTEVQELRLQNAFLVDNSFKWANPKAALKLADLSKVEIEDDGTVTGLDVALKALAKSDPYLLATGDDEDDDEVVPAGQPPKRQKPKGTPERQKLIDKYPALRR